MKLKILLGAVGTAAMLFGTQAFALNLTAGDADCTATFNQVQPPQDSVFLAFCGATTGTLRYKDNVGGQESGTFATSYSVTYTPEDANKAEGFTLSYTGNGAVGTYISPCPTCWLVVKDGNADPAFYGFNLGSWDGQTSITVTGLFPQTSQTNNGAISHVSIWTTGGGGDTPLPEPGTLALLGLGLVGLGFARRKIF